MIRRGPEVINPDCVATRVVVETQSGLRLGRKVCIATLPDGELLMQLGSLGQLGFWIGEEAEYGIHRGRLSTVAEVFRNPRFEGFSGRQLEGFSRPVDEIRAEIQGGHRLLVEGPYMAPRSPGAPAFLIQETRALWAPVLEVFGMGGTQWVLK